MFDQSVKKYKTSSCKHMVEALTDSAHYSREGVSRASICCPSSLAQIPDLLRVLSWPLRNMIFTSSASQSFNSNLNLMILISPRDDLPSSFGSFHGRGCRFLLRKAPGLAPKERHALCRLRPSCFPIRDDLGTGAVKGGSSPFPSYKTILNICISPTSRTG